MSAIFYMPALLHSILWHGWVHAFAVGIDAANNIADLHLSHKVSARCEFSSKECGVTEGH